MISIIIPLYNKAPYIRKCLQSILAQTFVDYELIVVNDGSTDNSLEILYLELKEMGFPADKIQIIDQENQGVSTARNNGVRLAKYDYIAFLDADDWWDATYLEEMNRLCTDFPDAGIWGCTYTIVKNGQTRLPRNGVHSGFRGYIDYFQCYRKGGEMTLWTGAAVVRKDFFLQIGGFMPGLKMGEDFYLWATIASRKPVAFTSTPLAFYNQDVDLKNRAVGLHLYKPEQHFLFADYSHLTSNIDFQDLFEVLALYGLLPYYLAGKNRQQVMEILAKVHWGRHAFKYRLYYRILPSVIVKFWLKIQNVGVKIKNKLKAYL